jgi:ring-1,2-phenylacetyl-CoA epoxidase subunit PaaD
MPDLSLDKVWQALEQVKDPEIPVVSVVEMGLIRSAGWDGDTLVISMTPTFAGCPALQVMQEEIAARLLESGAGRVDVRLTYSPPWSSDWITPSARLKLKQFGLAPPPMLGEAELDVLFEQVSCPFCGSQDAELKNSFGPTLCRAIYFCNRCRQPFEAFKPV